MKLARDANGKVVVEVEKGDFPEGTEAYRNGDRYAIYYDGIKYQSPGEVADHIDALVQIEKSWQEYFELSQLAPKG